MVSIAVPLEILMLETEGEVKELRTKVIKVSRVSCFFSKIIPKPNSCTVKLAL